MQRIIIDGVDYLPLRGILRIVHRTVFFLALGLGIGIVVSLPYLYQSQKLLGIQNRIDLEKCQMQSARVMLAAEEAQKYCTVQARRGMRMEGMGGDN